MHLLAHSSPPPGCGGQNTTKASAVHTRTWTDHSTTMLTGKTDSTCGKNTSSSFPTNQITLAEGEREPDLKHTPSPHPSLLPRLSFAPDSSTYFPPATQRARNGGCGQFITCCFCCSFLLRGRTPHTLPQLQHGVPLMGVSPPRASPV